MTNPHPSNPDYSKTVSAISELNQTAISAPSFRRKAELYQQALRDIDSEEISLKDEAMIGRNHAEPGTNAYKDYERYVAKSKQVSNARAGVLLKLATHFNKPSKVDESALDSEIDTLSQYESDLETIAQTVQDRMNTDKPPNVPARVKLTRLDVTDTNISNSGEISVESEVKNTSNTDAKDVDIVVNTRTGQRSTTIPDLPAGETRTVSSIAPVTSAGKHDIYATTAVGNGSTKTDNRSYSVSDEPLSTGPKRVRSTDKSSSDGSSLSYNVTHEYGRIAIDGTVRASDSNREPTIEKASVDSNNNMDVKIGTKTTSSSGNGSVTDIKYKAVMQMKCGVPGQTPDSVNVTQENETK